MPSLKRPLPSRKPPPGQGQSFKLPEKIAGRLRRVVAECKLELKEASTQGGYSHAYHCVNGTTSSILFLYVNDNLTDRCLKPQYLEVLDSTLSHMQRLHLFILGDWHINFEYQRAARLWKKYGWVQETIIIPCSDAATLNEDELKEALQHWVDDSKQLPVGQEGEYVTNEPTPPPHSAEMDVSTSQIAKKAFISYSHKDSEVADKVEYFLKNEFIDVTKDTLSMKAGQSIQEFLQNSIGDADVTLLIVSSDSLLSGWVAQETLTTLQSRKKFIACYIDDAFLQEDFVFGAVAKIDRRLADIQVRLRKAYKNRISSVDIDDEKKRLDELRGQLPNILQRLKTTYTVDIRESKLGEGLAKIVQTIRGTPIVTIEPKLVSQEDKQKELHPEAVPNKVEWNNPRL
jgi:hypothetical protein